MNIFDIMGPIMVGPSSSHTGGAARIEPHHPPSAGELARGGGAAPPRLLCRHRQRHGTDRALWPDSRACSRRSPHPPRLCSGPRVGHGLESLPPPSSAAPTPTPSSSRVRGPGRAGAGGQRLTPWAAAGYRVNIYIDGMECTFTGDCPTSSSAMRTGGTPWRRSPPSSPPPGKHRHHAALPGPRGAVWPSWCWKATQPIWREDDRRRTAFLPAS